jgi:hypothetical protein
MKYKQTGIFADNGQEVCAGDKITCEVRNDYKNPIFVGVVEWHAPTAAFLARDEKGFTRSMNSFHSIKITGN